MSLLDTASLIVTPNGYKEGTLYSVVPSSGAGDLSVTRATTATRVNSSGLIESVGTNIPRLDYSNGSCPSILVEPQRTNLLTYSEQFDNGAWNVYNQVTITANSSTAPNGTTTADRLQATGSSWYFSQQKSLTLGVVHTISMYVKSNTGSNQTFKFFACGSLASADFTATNNWQRFEFTFTSTTDTPHGIARDSSDNTADLLVWGAQLEAGSYATSYIPTTSASVTRNADVISKTGISSLIGQTEGTIFVDFEFDGTGYGATNDFFLYVGDGANTDAIYIDYYNGIFRWVVFNGSTLAFYTDLATTNGRHKLALAYKAGQYVAYADGSLILADTNATAPPTCSMVSLAQNVTGFGNIAKNINASALWKTRLTNSQIAQLTTL